jgi:hypothetical protein
MLVLDGKALERNRASIKSIERLAIALKDLRSKADRLAAAAKVYSVMDKKQVPPGGDKHDYMSQAPYWWPDPSKPNGLPYIRRDGQRNPELNKISDASAMDDMVGDVEILSLAFYFTGDEKYARHAAALIRTWFVDPKTRQNPNLNFAQGIPGISSGRGIGLIETRDLYRVIDASVLLERSASWTAADISSLKRWFADYLQWMTTSPVGLDEADERNNHGTYYDVQVLAYAIYTGQKDLARKQIEVSKSRIRSQIEPDGSQLHELDRTLSWDYTNMNLFGFFTIARLAEHVDADLWNFETDGRGIKKAFLWTLPYVRDEKKWTYQQIKDRKFGHTVSIIRTASHKFAQADHSVLADRLAAAKGESSLAILTR